MRTTPCLCWLIVAQLGCGTTDPNSANSSTATSGSGGNGGSVSPTTGGTTNVAGRSVATLGGAPGGTSQGGTSSLGGAATGGTSLANAAGGGNTGVDPNCPWRASWIEKSVATPFAAPNQILTFVPPSIRCERFDITKYGAKTGGTTSNTSAFAAAVSAASAAGGGVVIVPAGTWLTGAIQLASHIELHLEAGATILFSQNTSDYLPAVLTRWEGLDVVNWSPFIYVRDATDVAITGPGGGAFTGILDGRGSTWWGWKASSATEDKRMYDYYVAKLSADGTLPVPLPPAPTSAVVNGLRPSMIECHGCSNFLVDGIKTLNPAYWVIHPVYSKNVIIRNSNITSNSSGSNGDGVDIDSCERVLIEDTTFSTSDDIISIKSGLNEVGLAVNRPSARIVIRNISATAGHALSIGSEMSGGINDVYVTADDTNTLDSMSNLLRIKTLPGRGGTMQNIWFERVTGNNWASYAIEMTTNYGSSTIVPHNSALLPHLRNVTIANVSGTSSFGPALNLEGLSQAPFEAIRFDTVSLTGTTPNGCRATSGVSLSGSSITGVASTSLTCP